MKKKENETSREKFNKERKTAVYEHRDMGLDEWPDHLYLCIYLFHVVLG